MTLVLRMVGYLGTPDWEPMVMRRRRCRKSNGSVPLTMLPCAMPLVQFARRNLSQHGPRRCRIGFGKTLSELVVECTMLAATQKSPKTGQLQAARSLPWGARGPQIQYLESARRRYVELCLSSGSQQGTLTIPTY